MSNINLLPPDLKEMYETSKKNRMLINILILIFFFVSIFWFLLYLSNNYLKNKSNALDNQISKKERSITKYGSLEREAQKLNERLEDIKKIMSEKVYFSKALDQIWSSIPNKVFILSLNMEKDSTKRGKIIGTAETKKDVADFVKSLESKEIFEYVDIENSTTVYDDFLKRNAENFTLTFSIKPKSLNQNE